MFEFDADSFSGNAPIFPLSNVILFPHLILPLHIFENRYREMTRDALAGENLIAMALYKPDMEVEESPGIPFHDTVALGQIMQHDSLPDGKFNLALLGVARARVKSAQRKKPYWQGDLEILEEDIDANDVGQNKAHYDALWKNYGSLLAAPAKALPLPVLCDLIASTFVTDVRIKQQFLETVDISKRCERLIALAPPQTRSRWPKFSDN